MNETRILGIRVRFQNEINANAVENLRNTLRLVPTPHLRIIRQIDVVPPLNFGSNPRYAGGGSGRGYPRLSELCFDNHYNFPHNLTLLHEIGHIVENSYHCLVNMAPDQRAVLDAIEIPATARTHGAGEHYAIAYQQVINGRASERVRNAVFSSRAFSGVDTIHL